jgi:hypothetical protein
MTKSKDTVLILDTSNIDSFADYSGLIHELKTIDIIDDRDYQIDQNNDLLMYSTSYLRCKKILKKFSVIAVNTK